MNSKESMYSWHLSLRVDRPVEGCTVRPHSYMYGKKLDDRDTGQNHSKVCREPPPNHEFSYRWFRGPSVEPCAYEGCPRRTSFSPHEWSKHALGGSGCSLQCVSTQSSLYKSTFCNATCFVKAWKTQYTVESSGGIIPQARSSTPTRRRTGSYVDDDDARSVGSTNSIRSGMSSNYNNTPGTPREISVEGPNTPRIGGDLSQGYNHEYGGGQSEEWVEVSHDQLYIPRGEDVGRKLKLEAAAYSVESGELLMHRVVKTDLVLSRTPDPEKRNLLTAKSAAGGGARFRIVTYNILAEIYATQQQYPYADLWALSWEFRFQNIIREIVDVGPDIVCLQEVQADHYESHLYNAMHEAGFEGVYKQKTRQAMGLTGKVDGCALFWRRTKFHLIESYSIEFNELAQRQVTTVMGLNPRSEEGASILNKLSKDNVAQLVVLELAQQSMASRSNRDPINQVCIANTHLYSNKDCPDVKLWQTLHLLQELETFVMARGTNLPLMICGDFNSTPESAVYDLLSRQAVHPGHPDVNISDESGPNVLPDIMSITHSHMLGSVYSSVLGEEPKFTNYTMQFKGVLDYMWYSTQNLRPLSAAPIPDESVLTRHGDALPSTQYSSDHLMQISDMQIVGGGAR